MNTATATLRRSGAIGPRFLALAGLFYLLFLFGPLGLIETLNGLDRLDWAPLAVGLVASGIACLALVLVRKTARRSNTTLMAVGIFLAILGLFATFVELVAFAWYGGGSSALVSLLFLLPGAFVVAAGTV